MPEAPLRSTSFRPAGAPSLTQAPGARVTQDGPAGFNARVRRSLLALVPTSRWLLGSHPNQGGDPGAKGAPRHRGGAGDRAGGTGDSEV